MRDLLMLPQMPHDPSLAAKFEEEMFHLYEAAKKEGYNANYFLRMLREHGGVQTAKRLLASPQMNTGLARLFELDLLHLSVEQLVLTPPYTGLFEPEERKTARDRLAALRR